MTIAVDWDIKTQSKQTSNSNFEGHSNGSTENLANSACCEIFHNLIPQLTKYVMVHVYSFCNFHSLCSLILSIHLVCNLICLYVQQGQSFCFKVVLELLYGFHSYWS